MAPGSAASEKLVGIMHQGIDFSAKTSDNEGKGDKSDGCLFSVGKGR